MRSRCHWRPRLLRGPTSGQRRPEVGRRLWLFGGRAGLASWPPLRGLYVSEFTSGLQTCKILFAEWKSSFWNNWDKKSLQKEDIIPRSREAPAGFPAYDSRRKKLEQRLICILPKIKFLDNTVPNLERRGKRGKYPACDW